VIADRAGVGKGTVYRYFGSKEKLFWATTLEVFTRLRKGLLAAIQDVDGTLEKLRAAALAYAGFFDANPDYLEVIVQERAEFRGSRPDTHRRAHEELTDYFAAIVEEGVSADEIRPLDARKSLISLGGILYGSVVYVCYVSDDHTLAEIAEHAVNMFLEGIRARTPQTTGGTR
jgi:AcrR family transcriptional regulator